MFDIPEKLVNRYLATADRIDSISERVLRILKAIEDGKKGISITIWLSDPPQLSEHPQISHETNNR